METVSYVAYSAGWRIVRLLPERLAYVLFERIAALATGRNGRSVQRLRSNLASVTGMRVGSPELDRLTERAMTSYLRYWCDAFRLPDWSRERILDRAEIIHEHHLVEATSGGRGAVVSLPHSGNWDHAGAWATVRGWKVVTVAEVLRPRRLFERFLAYRRELGFEVHPFGAPNVVAILSQRLREGAVVALVSDRDLSRQGVPVTFFGRPTRMPKGPAALCLATGAALVPAHVGFNERGIVVTFYPPVRTDLDGDAGIADLTQKCADAFSQGIAARPEDWHMLQRIWVDE